MNGHPPGQQPRWLPHMTATATCWYLIHCVTMNDAGLHGRLQRELREPVLALSWAQGRPAVLAGGVNHFRKGKTGRVFGQV